MSARYPLVRNSSALATRAGVRCKPSRSGSSPSSGRISRTSSSSERVAISVELPAFINFKDVPLRLGDANFFQLWPGTWKHLCPSLFQTPMDKQPKIFRGGHDSAELFDLLVQILVIHGRQNALAHQAVERGRVDGAPGASVHRPPNTHLEHVIVPVPERIIALPIQAIILLLRQTVGVQAVRGRKSVAASHPDHCASPK